MLLTEMNAKVAKQCQFEVMLQNQYINKVLKRVKLKRKQSLFLTKQKLKTNSDQVSQIKTAALLTATTVESLPQDHKIGRLQEMDAYEKLCISVEFFVNDALRLISRGR